MGRKSQSNGALFEDLFYRRCMHPQIAVTRIPDGCRQVRGRTGFNLVRVKTHWDWVITYKSKTALIDTKTSQGSTFRHSDIVTHQVAELFNHEANGALAGYVIWLRESNKVFFIPARALLEAVKSRGSLSETHPEAILLGDLYFDIRKLFGTNTDDLSESPGK